MDEVTVLVKERALTAIDTCQLLALLHNSHKAAGPVEALYTRPRARVLSKRGKYGLLFELHVVCAKFGDERVVMRVCRQKKTAIGVDYTLKFLVERQLSAFHRWSAVWVDILATNDKSRLEGSVIW